LFGKRVYFWSIGWIEKPAGIKGLVRKLYLRIPHKLLLYGHFAKQIGVTEGFSHDKMQVVYNSLDFATQQNASANLPPDNCSRTKARLGIDSGSAIVSCISRLSTHRRIDLLIEATRILIEQGAKITLVLVGDGPEMDQLKRLAADAKIPVLFTGAIYDEARISEIISASNVLVAPGMSGLTTMHALAYGTPVITHDDPYAQAPESEAVIPGVTGDLFRLGDVADLAHKMQPWVEHSETPKEISNACVGIIERFYTPWFQSAAIERILLGNDADDLFFLREGVPQPATREKLAPSPE
jgi:glycosyltransferase involved in cell wall biosynthesis